MSHDQSPVQLACREDQRKVTAKRRSVYDSMTSTSIALGYPQQLANVRTTDLPTLRLQATTHESATTVPASHISGTEGSAYE